MIELAVYSTEGQEVEKLSIDESVLGETVRYPLLKQAIVMYQANKRVGTAATKNRGLVAGSTKKLYRQKGTGNARMGTRRTCVRVGGGVAFAKEARDFSQRMPKKQRRLARDSAILAKLISQKVVVVSDLSLAAPRTKDFAGILTKLGIKRSCLVTTKAVDQNVYKSARNIRRIDVLPVGDLNAGDVCNHDKVLFTKDAWIAFMDRTGAN